MLLQQQTHVWQQPELAIVHSATGYLGGCQNRCCRRHDSTGRRPPPNPCGDSQTTLWWMYTCINASVAICCCFCRLF
jgi:hypothetical protein